MIVVFVCLPLKRAVIILSETGFNAIKAFLCFWCHDDGNTFFMVVIFLSEYKIIFLELVIAPFPVHLLSLIPMISMLYFFISLSICAALPASYIVRTFHAPMYWACFGCNNDGNNDGLFVLLAVIFPFLKW